MLVQVLAKKAMKNMPNNSSPRCEHESIPCVFCNKSYKIESTFDTHMRSNHRDKIEQLQKQRGLLKQRQDDLSTVGRIRTIIHTNSKTKMIIIMFFILTKTDSRKHLTEMQSS